MTTFKEIKEALKAQAGEDEGADPDPEHPKGDGDAGPDDTKWSALPYKIRKKLHKKHTEWLLANGITADDISFLYDWNWSPWSDTAHSKNQRMHDILMKWPGPHKTGDVIRSQGGWGDDSYKDYYMTMKKGDILGLTRFVAATKKKKPVWGEWNLTMYIELKTGAPDMSKLFIDFYDEYEILIPEGTQFLIDKVDQSNPDQPKMWMTEKVKKGKK